jgi:hypothetical protein
LDEGSVVQYNDQLKPGSLRKYIFGHSLQYGTECWLFSVSRLHVDFYTCIRGSLQMLPFQSGKRCYQLVHEF